MASKPGGRGYSRGCHRKKYKSETSFFKDGESKKNMDLDESSPVFQAFKIFQKELDNRNDRNERIVKLSRDITIESKRIIFLLQRCTGLSDRESVLSGATAKFEELYKTKFYPLALELEGEDPYQYLKAFSPGLQEYIEAVTFYHYLLNENLVGVDKVQCDLTFRKKTLDSDPAHVSPCNSSEQTTSTLKGNKNITPHHVKERDPVHSGTCKVPDVKLERKVFVPVLPSEYMLGVADFTGELMRMAINSVGAGDLETPSLVLSLMRVISCAFNNFGNVPRELRQKSKVLSQSLQKVERACYTLRVRGSEIPTHMLADVFITAGSIPIDNDHTEDADEHFD